MKKLLSFICVMVVLAINSTSSQTYKDAWILGFGFSGPRFVGTDINGKDFTYGGFVSLQRDFSEHVSFRAKDYAHYLLVTGKKYSTFIVGGGFDLLYHFVPCEMISPYFSAGVSGIMFKVKNSPIVKDKWYIDYSVNFGFGVNWKIIDEDWLIKTEANTHTVPNDKLEGANGDVGGVWGGTIDNYWSFELGMLYYLDKGEYSKYCDIYSGITANITADAKVDYDRIEEIVKKYTQKPAEVDYNRIEDIFKKNLPTMGGKEGESTTSSFFMNWVLIGVNFEFGKNTLTPESYPILFNAVQILLSNQSMKVEIQGYTDNVGSPEYNKKLSIQRAEIVKKYLVAKGVSSSRLTTIGYGESNPISDNTTADGRGLNRRIEFKVLGK